jgi:hypothetical protein
MLRRGGRSGAGHSREHYGDGLPVGHAPPLVPEQRRRSLGLPVLQESSQVCVKCSKELEGHGMRYASAAGICCTFSCSADRALAGLAAARPAVSGGHAETC